MIAGCFFQANGAAWITELIFDYVYVLAGMLIWSPWDEEDEEFCSVRRKETQIKERMSTSQTDFFKSQLQGAVGGLHVTGIRGRGWLFQGHRGSVFVQVGYSRTTSLTSGHLEKDTSP